MVALDAFGVITEASWTNAASPRQVGVHLRERLERADWRYDLSLDGPPTAGRSMSECYPYTTIVGAIELGYDERRPAYKRAKKGVPAAQGWPERIAACDTLIQRIAALRDHEIPILIHELECYEEIVERDRGRKPDRASRRLPGWVSRLYVDG